MYKTGQLKHLIKSIYIVLPGSEQKIAMGVPVLAIVHHAT